MATKRAKLGKGRINLNRINPAKPLLPLSVSQSGGGSGETNSGANVGGENEVFKSKSGVALQFRTLKAGTNVSMTQNTDDITINASAPAGSFSLSDITGATNESDIANDDTIVFNDVSAGALREGTRADFVNDPVITKSAGSVTLTSADYETFVVVQSNAAAQTITLPAVVAADVGRRINIHNKGSDDMTVTSASSIVGSTTNQAGFGFTAKCTATGEWTLVGTGVASSSGLTVQAEQAVAFTAVAGNAYPVDVSGAAITVTAPATATAGDKFRVVDAYANASTNNITVDFNTPLIYGTADTYVINADYTSLEFIYISAGRGWVLNS